MKPQSNKVALLVWLLTAALFSVILPVMIPTREGQTLTKTTISVIIWMVLIMGPFTLALYLYDVVDKVIDPRFAPRVIITVKGHMRIACSLAGIIAVLWLMLAIVVTATDALMLGAWQQYIAPLSSNLRFGFPTYAWEWSLWAGVTALAGYFYEQAILWIIRKRS